MIMANKGYYRNCDKCIYVCNQMTRSYMSCYKLTSQLTTHTKLACNSVLLLRKKNYIYSGMLLKDIYQAKILTQDR